MTGVTPPEEAPRDNPRPGVTRLAKWPFFLLGGCAVVALTAITVGPRFWSDPVQVAQAEPEMRSTQPRGLVNGAKTYADVQQPTPEEKKQEEKQQEQQVAQQYQENQQQGQQYQQQAQGGGNSGPTRAELRKAARMADLKSFPVSFDEDQAGGGGQGGGGTMYSQNKLTGPMPCQVNAGTHIAAQMELTMTSETVGKATAITTRDVWSADKKCKAMPRGTRFYGTYATEVREGQTRLAVLWAGLTRPPPHNDTMELTDVVAGEPDGSSGVKGDVNTHFWSKLGYVGAATILDLGRTAVTAGGEGGVGTAIAGIFANRASSPLDEWAKKKLDVPDVITTKPKAISIILSQHIGMNDFRKVSKLR